MIPLLTPERGSKFAIAGAIPFQPSFLRPITGNSLSCGGGKEVIFGLGEQVGDPSALLGG